MEPDKAYTLKHSRFGEIATFRLRPREGTALVFSVTAPSKQHGNLAQEWINRKMVQQGFLPDNRAVPNYPKWCRCHSRKRYMKLLMGAGFNRRNATLWCEFVQTTKEIRKGNFSYQEAWLSYIFAFCHVEADNPEMGSE